MLYHLSYPPGKFRWTGLHKIANRYRVCQRETGQRSSATMNDMKIALLGAMGFVGQVAARALARHPEVRELLLVDYNIRETKKFGRALSPKCRWAMADVGRAPELARLLGDVDAVSSVRVEWPDGRVTDLERVPTGQVVTVAP